MRLYLATLYTSGPNAIPVTYDGGVTVEQEMSAENAGKARYRFWRYLVDAWGDDVLLQRIRVKSLSKYAPRHMDNGWQQRLEKANAIVRVIGSHGRHFLSENSDRRDMVDNPFFAHFTVDARRELWFVDRYTRKPVLLRHRDWQHFSDGGTLRSLVEHLGNYIKGGADINMRVFGPWPEWVCDGDLWAYGEDMQKVRDGVAVILEESKGAA